MRAHEEYFHADGDIRRLWNCGDLDDFIFQDEEWYESER